MTFLAPAPTTVVEVTGADRLSYLEAVTSQHLLDAEPGDVRGALHLDPHGAPLAMFDVVVLPERLLLLAPDGEVAVRVVEVLGGRTFLSDARFSRRDDAVLALRGDDARTCAEAVGLPATPGAAEHDGLVVVPADGGLDLVGQESALAPVRERLVDAGVSPAGEDDLEAWCIEHGQPRWGREVAPPHLPEEVGVLATHVHLAKGCYPGQEAVARMWMLGRPRRRLARVALDTGVGPGWRVGSGKRAVEVTAAAGDRGLAFVPADAEPGQHLTADDEDGGVTVLGFVGDGLDVPGHDPRVTRRRDRR